MLKPKFIVPTFKATKKTITICDQLFGNDHHSNNRTNAFRHALWNYMLCEEYQKVSISTEIAMEWSRKVTDLHENLIPNSELAKAMDLHNNQIGRKLFEESAASKIQIIDLLKEMMEHAIMVKNIQELQETGDKLIFIEKKTTK
ncbi:DUF6973 domain-containing protein [Autumnicola psychrophila]|uniref:DUF6973 domain-containing protein n=1 Tax=Autumnicola psychrophila TaxID=3075592 RepID=A0ABU3DP15_9FLAO|nr:hypothetical protein [Zunongwangia sp. F225]MDT0685449.1 hypothetical protein [Zunongwangia sp. F225]